MHGLDGRISLSDRLYFELPFVILRGHSARDWDAV